MATWDVVHSDLESILRHAPLEVDREESIVASADDVNGDGGPGLESAGLAEHDVRLWALACLAPRDDLGWNVMQEVGVEIEVRAVAAASQPPLALSPSRCCPTTPQPSHREPESWR